MKGVIAACLQELVKEKFGNEKWEEALKKAGVDPTTKFMPIQDIDDQAVLKVINSVCGVLHITLLQAADVFGEYWVNTYARKLYGMYYNKATNAKDFLLKMDNVHEITTRTVKNARPPRFEYEWKDDKTLIMTYKSARGLIDFLVGLVKGVGIYFKESLKVTKLSSDKIQIVFPN
jgi:hypothetical protein